MCEENTVKTCSIILYWRKCITRLNIILYLTGSTLLYCKGSVSGYVRLNFYFKNYGFESWVRANGLNIFSSPKFLIHFSRKEFWRYVLVLQTNGVLIEINASFRQGSGRMRVKIALSFFIQWTPNPALACAHILWGVLFDLFPLGCSIDLFPLGCLILNVSPRVFYLTFFS